MKRIQLLLMAFLLATSMAAFSQSNPDAQGPPEGHHGQHGREGMRGMNPQNQLDRMSQELNLTEDQKSKIKPILEDSFKQMQQLRQDSSLSETDRRSKMKEIHENLVSQVRPILNPDQQKKLESMHGPGGRGGHGRQDHGQDENSKPQ